jgi:hypothetical protein
MRIIVVFLTKSDKLKYISRERLTVLLIVHNLFGNSLNRSNGHFGLFIHVFPHVLFGLNTDN